MTKLDRKRQAIVDAVKRFEETTHEIRSMTDQLHEKIKKLNVELPAIKGRARAAREKAGRVAASKKITD